MRPTARPKPALDRRGEDAAAAHVTSRGARILARNWRGGGGELDLVVEDGDAITFLEVKARATSSRGLPGESVTPAKIRRMTGAALAWLAETGRLETAACRFDLVAVAAEGGRLVVVWTKGAFDASLPE